MRSELTEALGDLLKRFIARKIMVAIAARIPFLVAGPLGWVASFFVSWAVGKVLAIILEKTELGFRFLWVDIRISAESSGYIQAYANLRAATTQEEKANAKAALDRAFYSFIEY